MKLAPECYACFLNQAVRTVRVMTQDRVALFEVLREVSRILTVADAELPPPVVSTEIYKCIHTILNIDDPYRDLKNRYNKEAFGYLTEAKGIVCSSSDPLRAALMVALAGNIIDFGSQVTSFNVGKTLRESVASPLDIDDYEAFRGAVESAKTMVFISDNAGEIVFDSLLLETVRGMFPTLRLFIIGRGSPIINDATAQELVELGFGRYGEVVSSEQMIPALWVDRCGNRCRRIFEEADLVLAKGQGNFETLSELPDDRVYFLFMVKCSVVSEMLSVGKLARVFLRNGRGVWERLQV